MRAAEPRGTSAAVWVAAGACALVATVVLYPGQYPYDAVNQLWQARTGHLGDGSPVTMTALWSLLLRLTGDPGALFLVNVALFWIGLALCVAVVEARLLSRIALLIVIGFSPLALVQMGHVLTDAHLAAAMMLATGFAAWGSIAGKRAALVACGALLVYAGCIRMNAITATAPFAFAMAAFGRVRTTGRALLSGLVAALCIVVCTAALAFALDRSLVKWHITAWPTLVLWDLAAISVASDRLLLPAFTHGDGLTVEELERTRAFDEAVNVPLFQRSQSGVNDGYGRPYTPVQKRELLAAWLAAVRTYPAAYLHHRLRTFGLLIGTHEKLPGFAYIHGRIQYKDNPALPDMLAPRAQEALYRLAARLEPGWVFAALPYLVLSMAACVAGWMRRDRTAGVLAVSVAGSTLVYAVAYVVLAPAAELRYLTWPIVAAPLALTFALSRSPQTGRA